jgi:hypothetical protein
MNSYCFSTCNFFLQYGIIVPGQNNYDQKEFEFYVN